MCSRYRFAKGAVVLVISALLPGEEVTVTGSSVAGVSVASAIWHAGGDTVTHTPAEVAILALHHLGSIIKGTGSPFSIQLCKWRLCFSKIRPVRSEEL